jgi:hypothetical protein
VNVSCRVFRRNALVVAHDIISGCVSRHGTSELASVWVSSDFGGVCKSAGDR